MRMSLAVQVFDLLVVLDEKLGQLKSLYIDHPVETINI